MESKIIILIKRVWESRVIYKSETSQIKGYVIRRLPKNFKWTYKLCVEKQVIYSVVSMI